MIDWNWEDLLTVPYKAHGRDTRGFDCYGLVLECCRRCGNPIPDLYYKADSVPQEFLAAIQRGLPVEKVDSPQAGDLVECVHNGNLHIGFLVEKNRMIHATSVGVRISHPKIMGEPTYYRIKEQDND